MKRKFSILMIVSVLGLLLLFPDSVSRGAREGLMLWFSVVFPALLPFMIISGVIVRMGITSAIGRVIYPFAHKLLHITENGCYPVVIGLLSGYPLGAKTIADMCRTESISKREGQYLLTFCNNASPMFMLEYMGIYCMGMKKPYYLMIVVYLSAFLNALLFQKSLGCCKMRDGYCVTGGNACPSNRYVRCQNRSFMEALDDSILDSFVTLAKVGGYIILFSILAQLVEELLPLSIPVKVAGLGIIEITTGGEYLKNFVTDYTQVWIFGAVFCAFGGFSSIAQTASVIQGSGLSVKKYILAKVCHALFAGVLALLLGRFIV